uniref:Uncharacterized protein n=1 Tax=viral metagenome TaxID=1070528 RepID=A0A6C0EDA8_9ZZZZ
MEENNCVNNYTYPDFDHYHYGNICWGYTKYGSYYKYNIDTLIDKILADTKIYETKNIHDESSEKPTVKLTECSYVKPTIKLVDNSKSRIIQIGKFHMKLRSRVKLVENLYIKPKVKLVENSYIKPRVKLVENSYIKPKVKLVENLYIKPKVKLVENSYIKPRVNLVENSYKKPRFEFVQ